MPQYVELSASTVGYLLVSTLTSEMNQALSEVSGEVIIEYQRNNPRIQQEVLRFIQQHWALLQERFGYTIPYQSTAEG